MLLDKEPATFSHAMGLVDGRLESKGNFSKIFYFFSFWRWFEVVGYNEIVVVVILWLGRR